MRKLILFLVRYNTAILFLLLQVVCIWLIYVSLSFQYSTMHRVSAEWSGRFIEGYNKVEDYLNLSSINKNLARENAKLKTINKNSYFSLISRRDSVIDTLYHLQYEYLEARVINSSFRKRNNYITLNKGSLHGVKPDMAVTSAQGVIGIVKNVSPHYSSIVPLIHGRSLIGAGFKKNSHFGSMSWDGKNYQYAQIRDVPREAEFSVGDTIVSDTRSISFPGNLMVGTVESFELNQEDQTYLIQVKLSIDFSALDFVYIINNLFRIEQEELEKGNEE